MIFIVTSTIHSGAKPSKTQHLVYKKKKKKNKNFPLDKPDQVVYSICMVGAGPAERKKKEKKMGTIRVCVMGDSAERDHEVAWRGRGNYMPVGSAYGYLSAQVALLAAVEGSHGERLIARVDGCDELRGEDHWLTSWHSVGTGSIRELECSDAHVCPSDARLQAAR